jgi:hypothetical protein
VLDAGPTNPHTSLHLSGGLRAQRQIASTDTEAPTSRSGPLFVQPSQLAASFVFSTYNVAYWPKMGFQVAYGTDEEIEIQKKEAAN